MTDEETLSFVLPVSSEVMVFPVVARDAVVLSDETLSEFPGIDVVTLVLLPLNPEVVVTCIEVVLSVTDETSVLPVSDVAILVVVPSVTLVVVFLGLTVVTRGIVARLVVLLETLAEVVVVTFEKSLH